MHTYETLGLTIIQELINIRKDFKNDIERLGDRLEKCLSFCDTQACSIVNNKTVDQDNSVTPVALSSKSENIAAAALVDACANSDESESRNFDCSIVKVENLDDALTTVEVELTDSPYATGSNSEENNISSLLDVEKDQDTLSFQTTSISVAEKMYSDEPITKAISQIAEKVYSDEPDATLKDQPSLLNIPSYSSCLVNTLSTSHKERMKRFTKSLIPNERKSAMSKKFIGARMKRFKCETCNKSFSTRINLKFHSQTHLDIKPNVCPLCNLKFTQKFDLDRHISLHKEETLFSCEKCDRKFIESDALTNHLLAHEKKVYACDVCGSSFTRRSDVARHMRLHTGETPYTCEECGKKFRRSDSLKNHMRVHEKSVDNYSFD